MTARSGANAARTARDILTQLEPCLAGDSRRVVLHEGDRSSNRTTQNLDTDAVEVWIRPAQVDGCRDDVAAALVGAHAALAALAGLLCPRGVVAEVDAADVVATCQGDHLSNLICPRADHAGRSRGAVDVLPCLDGYVGVQAATEEDRHLLSRLADGEDVAAWVARRTRAQVVEAGQLWRLPIVPVLEPAEVTRAQIFRFSWLPVPSRRRATRAGYWPLSGLRVLDLGMVWAGPYCGRLLGGLGARVTKVEGPQRPDGTRRSDHVCQGAFADLNRGKSSLVVDLSHPDGRDVMLRLVRNADVLIENFSPRVMPNFGLDFEVLAQVNPKLVMLSMPAFADTDAVAYGSGMELAAGLVGWDTEARPMPSSVAYLDYLAGCYGAIAVIAAVLAGKGGHVTVAQRDVGSHVLALGGSNRQSRPGMTVHHDRLAESARRSGLLTRRACRHYARLPFRFAGLARRREADAPRFGAHTWRVLRRDADLTPTDIDALLASGVVR
jgi:crotonobetainyl-CoA:carnitine CoA-transferase CaiB-like acyl-CoA transferase